LKRFLQPLTYVGVGVFIGELIVTHCNVVDAASANWRKSRLGYEGGS
jgi:hypothetical protein